MTDKKDTPPAETGRYLWECMSCEFATTDEQLAGEHTTMFRPLHAFRRKVMSAAEPAAPVSPPEEDGWRKVRRFDLKNPLTVSYPEVAPVSPEPPCPCMVSGSGYVYRLHTPDCPKVYAQRKAGTVGAKPVFSIERFLIDRGQHPDECVGGMSLYDILEEFETALRASSPAQPVGTPMTTPYTFKYQDGNWIAHAVALDLVAADPDPSRALEELKTVCIAQVGFGRENGRSLRSCYFAAPPEYWQPPFYFLEFDASEFIKWKRVAQQHMECPTDEDDENSKDVLPQRGREIPRPYLGRRLLKPNKLRRSDIPHAAQPVGSEDKEQG